jgi:hypothetical protein
MRKDEVRKMEQNSLWEQVGNRCLELARQELNKEAAPTAATVETVERLVGIAISIDDLNLRWVAQTRYDAAAFEGLASGRLRAKN